MLLLLHKPEKSNRNIQDFALIGAVLFEFINDGGLLTIFSNLENLYHFKDDCKHYRL